MPAKLETTNHFDRQVSKLNTDKLNGLSRTLKTFRYFLLTGEKTHGLRFKKIGKDKYEFRINASLRIVCKLLKDTYYLAVVGDHNTIQRYLKSFK